MCVYKTYKTQIASQTSCLGHFKGFSPGSRGCFGCCGIALCTDRVQVGGRRGVETIGTSEVSGGFHGDIQKWMVYKGKSQFFMDDHKWVPLHKWKPPF